MNGDGENFFFESENKLNENQNLWNQDLWHGGKAHELTTNKNLYFFQ